MTPERSQSVVRGDQDALIVRYCGTCGANLDATTSVCADCSQTRTLYSDSLVDGARVRSATRLFLVFLLFSVIVSATQWFGENNLLFVESLLVTDVLAFIVACAFAVRWRREVIPALSLPTSWQPWAIAILAAPFTWLLATVVLDSLSKWVGLEQFSYVEPFQNAGFGLGVVILSVCVQPAIVEELAFRGIMQPLLGSVLGARDSLIVVALLFGIAHLSPLSLPHLLVIGLILGVLRARTGSMLPGVLLHFLHNFLCVLSELWNG